MGLSEIPEFDTDVNDMLVPTNGRVLSLLRNIRSSFRNNPVPGATPEIPSAVLEGLLIASH